MIFEKVREFICDHFMVGEDEITENTSFVDDLDADSLDVVELAMSVEQEFGLPEVAEEDLKQIHTVGDIVAYIENAIG